MKFYGRKRRVNRKIAPKKRTYKKRGVSTAVKRYVSRSIKVASENKIVNWSYNGILYPFNASGSQWYTYNFIQISPNAINLTIPQSTTQAGRIGNQIKTVKGMLKLILTPRAFDANTNLKPTPQMIRVLIFSSKQKPITLPPFTDFQNYMFQLGASSVGPISGLLDIIGDVNKDLFTTYYDKTFKIGYAGAYSPASVAALTSNNQYFFNNDYKLNVMKKINITKYLAANYKFNDANSDPTAGRSLYVCFLQANADGTTSGPTQFQTNMSMDVDYTYEE